MNNQKIILNILAIFLGWLLVIVTISYFGLSLLPHLFEGKVLTWADHSTQFLIRFSNWDGGHFRGIAENGYLPFQVVFFPLYPLLIKLLMFFSLSSLSAGLLISSISTIISLLFLFKLTELETNQSLAKQAIIYLLSFPTAFYLVSVYSESLFLALAISSFYFARKKSWLLSFLLAGLSFVTRPIGIAVISAITLELLLNNHPKFSIRYLWQKIYLKIFIFLLMIQIIFKLLENISIEYHFWVLFSLTQVITYPLTYILYVYLILILILPILNNIDFRRLFSVQVLFILISLIPFTIYLLYLYITQGDPFIFAEYEKTIWHRHPKFPHETILNYFINLQNNRNFSIGATTQQLIEIGTVIFCAILFIYSLIKLRLSYSWYFGLTIFIPILSGTLIAIHRYALVAFPIMILLSMIKSENLRQLWIFFSLMLMGLLLIMFVNGFWVS